MRFSGLLMLDNQVNQDYGCIPIDRDIELRNKIGWHVLVLSFFVSSVLCFSLVCASRSDIELNIIPHTLHLYPPVVCAVICYTLYRHHVIIR